MSKRILIVDDEQGLLMALKKLLHGNSVEVDTAETINEAIAHINKTEYEVIIADIRLSGIMDQEGLRILQYVKDRKPGTRVLLMTGYGSPEIQEKAKNLGADFYIEKPVPIKVLKDALRTLDVS